ncbi:hypothetical protein WICPIJ_000698 [Wickerhamomyces pijperi]|uniref:Uncharacterized protein n=1 Tax=Wickerhamomyces pijperi TaxID=599730 RepID=A0A9P8QD45_WICPI|nr:hypothetical protein WICPIJ_000698 [Wickerhamomyces pijperi]
MAQNLPTELQWEILDHVFSAKDTKLDINKLKALSEIPKMRSLVSKYVCVLSVIAESSKTDYRKRKHSASEARVSDNCLEVVIPERLCAREDQSEYPYPMGFRFDSLCTEQKSEVRWKYLPLDLSDKLYAKNHKFLFIELHDYHKEPKDSVLLYRLPIWMFCKQRLKALRSRELPQEPFVLPKVLDPPIPTHIDIITPMKKGLKSMLDYDNYIEMAYFSRIAALSEHREKLPYNIDVNFAILENKKDLMPTAKCLAVMQFLPDFNKRSTSAHAEEEKEKVLRLADHQNTLCVDTIKSLSGSLVSKCPCCHSKRYQTQLADFPRMFLIWEESIKRYWHQNGIDRIYDNDMRLFGAVASFQLSESGWPVSQFPIVQDPLGRLARGLYTLGSNFGYMSEFMEGYVYSDLAERDIRNSERTAQLFWGAAIARVQRHYQIHREYDPEVDTEQRPRLSVFNPNLENSLSIDLVFFKGERDVFAAHQIPNKDSYEFLVDKCRKLDILYSRINSEKGYPSRFQTQTNSSKFFTGTMNRDSVLNQSNLYHHTLPDSKLSTKLKHSLKKLFQLKPDLCNEKAQYLDWYHQFLSLLTELPVISYADIQLLHKRFQKSGKTGKGKSDSDRGLNWLTLRNLRFQQYQNSLEKKVESDR